MDDASGSDDETDNGSHAQETTLRSVLHKARRLTKNVNASEKAWERFSEAQAAVLSTDDPIEYHQRKYRPLRLTRDVKTRWDSTYLMLRRLHRLKKAVNQYATVHDPQNKLRPDEWRMVEYLISITHPFCIFTHTIGQSKTSTVNVVFHVYNTLFNHLEKIEDILTRKTQSWKKLLLFGVQAALAKLRKYYTATEGLHGQIFGEAVLLTPSDKQKFFRTQEWAHEDSSQSYEEQYWEKLRRRWTEYKDRGTVDRTDMPSQQDELSLTGVAYMLQGRSRDKDDDDDSEDELSLYRGDRMLSLSYALDALC